MGLRKMASNIATKSSSVLGVAVITVLLDLLPVMYVTSHGFSTSNTTLSGVSLSLEWLPVIGVLLVSLAVAYDVFTRIFPRWLGAESDPTAKLRFLRVIATSLAIFVCVLYVPYLLGSNWFWVHLSHVSHLIGALQGFGVWLENLEVPILGLDPVLQYAATQIVASAALILSAWALARPARRPKKLR